MTRACRPASDRQLAAAQPVHRLSPPAARIFTERTHFSARTHTEYSPSSPSERTHFETGPGPAPVPFPHTSRPYDWPIPVDWVKSPNRLAEFPVNALETKASPLAQRVHTGTTPRR